MKLKSTNLIGIIILAIAIVVILAYYFLPNDLSNQRGEDDYFTLTIMDENLSAEEIAEYQQTFDLLVSEIKTTPDYVNPWFTLGRIKRYVGDYRGAEAAWIKAGEIRPGNSTSFVNLADLYANYLKEYDKAVAAYETAIGNSLGEFDNDKLYREYAYFAEHYLEDLDKTELILTSGIQDNPGSIDLITVLADFYKRHGNKEKALEYFKQAVKMDPEDPLLQQEVSSLEN